MPQDWRLPCCVCCFVLCLCLSFRYRVLGVVVSSFSHGCFHGQDLEVRAEGTASFCQSSKPQAPKPQGPRPKTSKARTHEAQARRRPLRKCCPQLRRQEERRPANPKRLWTPSIAPIVHRLRAETVKIFRPEPAICQVNLRNLKLPLLESLLNLLESLEKS